MARQFEFHKINMEGPFLIQPFCAEDSRGGFIKDYNIETFRSNGLLFDLKEVFFTQSKKGVIRANHFQLIKPQGKLIRCVCGHVYDVITDLRPESNTYMKWQGFHLYGTDPKELFVPRGFGHGYLVIEDSIVCYQCDEVFYEEGDSGIMWNDADISIDWPLEQIGGEQNLIISEKDRHLMTFIEYHERITGGGHGLVFQE